MKTEINSVAVMPQSHGGGLAPSLMTPEEAACFLRLDSIDTLAYYRKRHKLNATKIGKKLLYSKVELVKFIERMTTGGNK